MLTRVVPRSRWAAGLALITLLGLIIRLVYIALRYPYPAGGDQFYYHHGANLLVDGWGFIDPYEFLKKHQVVEGATHPPLFILYLAVFSLIGLTSMLAHQLATCLLGVITIVLMAYAGRRILGPRGGLASAFLAAVYPNFWVNNGFVLSETLAQLTTVVVILLAYRLWEKRDWISAALLGVGIALSILSRAEAVLLMVLLVVPLVGGIPAFSWRRRVALVAASWVASVLVIAPWAGYNFTRFRHPAPVTTGLGMAIRGATCNEAFYGELKGFWSLKCLEGPVQPDSSTQDLAYRRQSLLYVNAHLSDVPSVLLAREGRAWGWYRPQQIAILDNFVGGRPKVADEIALCTLYILEAGTIVGVVVLRRRRVPISPLVALIATVTITTAITFGETRYRATAEPALVLLSVAGIGGCWHRIRRSPRDVHNPVTTMASLPQPRGRRPEALPLPDRRYGGADT